MRIYTKSGDAGQTGLLGGARVAKDHPRIEACGSLDELNASLGLARCQGPSPEMDAILERIQRELFSLGADLAAVPDKTAQPRIAVEHVAQLEADIDPCEERLVPLTQFILPGGCPLACQLHFTRAICRRAERAVVTLGQADALPPAALRYLNRLSDLLFVLARTANRDAGLADVIWKAPDGPEARR